MSFRYASRAEQLVLDRVSFEALPGQQVALVGSSGSGKSTCFHLLENFYQPTRGRVTLDGVDIHALDERYLHSVLSIVSQEPTLFSGTIEDNILYPAHALMHALDAAPTAVSSARTSAAERRRLDKAYDYGDGASLGGDGFGLFADIDQGTPASAARLERVRTHFRARMIDAAKVACAHDFITALADGYQTEVGERGVQLSGGQRQRISIARAILLDPRVLLLDEATSSLDAQSESLVQAALERASKGRTTLIIAHRLSTIMHADRIVVFDRGRIVEQGTHAELLRGGVTGGGFTSYRELVSKQLSAAASSNV